MREYNTPVKKYWLKYTYFNENKELMTCELDILASNHDNALSMLDRRLEIDTITLRCVSGVVAMAQYTARNVSNELPSFYLKYHARPV